MKIKMLETVHYCGTVYYKGEIYNVSAQVAYAFGNSCAILEAPQEQKQMVTTPPKPPKKPRARGKNKMQLGSVTKA